MKNNSVNQAKKKNFFKEKEECEIPFTHIEENVEPSLKEIDEMFGAADVLSIEYSEKHHRNLILVSFIAPAIAFLFLIYDELSQTWLILVCLLLIAILAYVYKSSTNKKNHEKYLEYRVLAEALRVQYFLSKASVEKQAVDILPWFIKIGIPWIGDVLSNLPKIELGEKKPIINCWIRHQRDYHNNAFIKSTKKKKRDDFIENIILVVTILSYVTIFLFEVYRVSYIPNYLAFEPWYYAALKICIGTTSAITIFVANYYGKMSLSSKIEEHRRMTMLYEKAETDILKNNNVEDDELLTYLAQEFLIENTTWYAHQKKNKPSFDVE